MATSPSPSEHHQRVKEILAQLLDCAEHDRPAQLAALCDGDDALRRDVASLLGHVERPVIDVTAAARAAHAAVAEAIDDHVAEQEALDVVPERIADYRIAGVLGQGGMGVVYLAEQDTPRRTVALKVMRPGFAGRQLLRRFRREAELLGRLQHPNIAQIYAAGSTTLDGPRGPRPVPYFALEYVKGRTITEHCREMGLGVRERVKLFAQVSDAVDYAHGQGIVHRDLKPANILVEERTAGVTSSNGRSGGSTTPSAGAGIPKILDFGIARRTHDSGERATTTFQTEVGHVIGTLPYMSPEQVSGAPGTVDRRSDVYALGVMLYQLLSGRLPLEIGDRTIAEAVRMVSQDDPPSLRTLDRSLRGDLDTIVAKCLEKDRERRYQTAGQLASDLRRYLDDRPIEARPPSTLYQLGKFARRNRGLVVGVAVAFATLLAATVVSTYLARDAIVQRTRAEQQLRVAQIQGGRSAESFGFLASLLTAAEPMVAKGREMTVRDLLDTSRKRLEESPGKEVEVTAMLTRIVGFTYVRLGLLEEGEAMLRRSVELHRQVEASMVPEDRLQAIANLADVVRERGRYEEAIALLDEVVAESHAAGPAGTYPRALALNNLGMVQAARGRYAEAADALDRSLEIMRTLNMDQSEAAVIARINLAGLRLHLWQPERAGALLREAKELQERFGSPDHPLIETCIANLGLCARQLGRFEESLRTGREVLERRRAVLQPGHPSLLASVSSVAGYLVDIGRPAEAELFARDAVAGRTATLGRQHSDTALSMWVLACALLEQGKLDEADTTIDEAIAIHRATVGDSHQRLADDLIIRSRLDLLAGDLDAASAAAIEAVAVIDRGVGRNHPVGAQSLAQLGRALAAQRKLDEAVAKLREAEAAHRAVSGDGHPDVALTQLALADALLAAGDAVGAEPMASHAAETMRRCVPGTAWMAAQADVVRGRALRTLGREEEGEALMAAAVETVESALGPDAPATRDARSATAGARPSLLPPPREKVPRSGG